MFVIGCHLSASKGYLHMGEEAKSIGANTFQFFTRNPRGFSAKPFDAADAQAFVRHGILSKSKLSSLYIITCPPT